MAKPTKGNQKGPQAHAQGQHGEKTRRRLKEQINQDGAQNDAQDETGSQRAANDPNRHGKRSEEAVAKHERMMHEHEHDGRHRLMEERHQHDIADRNSGKNRLTKDVSRHGHEREQFQIRGGRETHPALPPDPPEDTIKSPMGGGR